MLEIRHNPNAPTIECPRCGQMVPMDEKVEVDTWNLGDYGCKWEDCRRVHLEWLPRQCPDCRAELDKKLSVIDEQILQLKNCKRAIEEEFWSGGK